MYFSIRSLREEIQIYCFKKKTIKDGVLSQHLSNVRQYLMELTNRPIPIPTEEELRLIEEIKSVTQELNLNNITRTKAYMDYYKRQPGIHWSFLAHMVSRNGGWNMTDLKGDFLKQLLDKQTRNDFFAFLERANWLIFQDAFPQLLIFEESVKQNRKLFHLLPTLHISVFMEAIWEGYWKTRNDYLLTVGLIVNEQNYIENRLMKSSYFKHEVLDSIEFKIQELLSFNQILFPYSVKEKTKLIGQNVNQFESLHERIMIGKKLYFLLFSDKQRLQALQNWAITNPHTGSRKDFWPHLFNDIKEYAPGNPFTSRLVNCKLKKRAPRIYSPKLEFAWQDIEHKPVEKGDWYRDLTITEYLLKDVKTVEGDIIDQYCDTLRKLELATIAIKAIF
jgi:hypothetical protein